MILNVYYDIYERFLLKINHIGIERKKKQQC